MAAQSASVHQQVIIEVLFAVRVEAFEWADFVDGRQRISRLAVQFCCTAGGSQLTRMAERTGNPLPHLYSIAECTHGVT